MNTLVEALRRHRTSWREAKLAGRRPLNDFDLVFTGTTVSREFRAILRLAQRPRIRFHDIRHAHASLMLTAHVRMEMVSALLGHSTVATTQNIYAHVLKPLREEARQVQARILGG